MTDPHALVGSQAAKYGGASELVYDQFELFSCERMRHQIVLLRDCIRNIKLTFNKEFDEVLKLKEAEIKRIKVCDLSIPLCTVASLVHCHYCTIGGKGSGVWSTVYTIFL